MTLTERSYIDSSNLARLASYHYFYLTVRYQWRPQLKADLRVKVMIGKPCSILDIQI